MFPSNPAYTVPSFASDHKSAFLIFFWPETH